MQLRFKDYPDFIFVEKPHGISSHTPAVGKWGLAEFVEAETGQKPFLFHRLDRETSGCILFAKSPEAAAEFSDIWKNRDVEKIYWCLTDRKVSFSEKTVRSSIAKKGNVFASDLTDENFNSETHFRVLGAFGKYTLIEAKPITGKPHQIRLHAQNLGVSLLGDELYDGSPFHRLALHARSLKFIRNNEVLEFASLPPEWMTQLELLADLELCAWISAVEKRERLQTRTAQDCIRLFHHEDADFRMDLFGSQFWLYDYNLSEEKKSKLLEFCKSRGWNTGFVRKMLNRGQNPGPSDLTMIGEPQSEWTAKENEMSFLFKSEQGLSPGLFLDQKYNRKWFLENSKDKDVLNLFSYTGGFSVAAGLGKAKQVTTVDLSKNFLAWSKQNFELNALNPEAHEFWASDAFIFLQGCHKRKRFFDLIICDPPSFSRMKDRVFRIEKDFPDLLDLCLGVLKPKGRLIFCTNFEKWTEAELLEAATPHSKKHGASAALLRSSSFDYEGFDREGLMKSIIFSK